jgi:nucleoside 2-deoxyribosyltransferase
LIQCDKTKRILIVGEVFVDRYLDRNMIRLGGVFHGARALHALGMEYAVAYICPSYLDGDCDRYFSTLKASVAQKIGDVTGAPNIMDVGDSAESGDQRYNDVLGQNRKTNLNILSLERLLRAFKPTDILTVAGDYDTELIDQIGNSNYRRYIDVDHRRSQEIGRVPAASTIFSSTSGNAFKIYSCNPTDLKNAFFSAGASTVILKENRGGSRGWVTPADDPEFTAPAFPVRTHHSVGVGDCFNAAWVASVEGELMDVRLRGCSYIASLYASTFDHEAFISDIAASLRVRDDLLALRGVRIPWEDRTSLSIYLAGPDFPYNDTHLLDELERALRYHNFRPRRPVRENGLADEQMTQAQQRSLYHQDLQLLEDCAMLIATPINSDPGTFTELGWFAHRGLPTILFDPTKSVSNLFALNISARRCNSVGDVIDTVFELLGESFEKQ